MTFGDSTAVAALASHVGASSVAMVDVGATVAAVEPRWAGHAGDAFRTTRDEHVADILENGAYISNGATCIQTYATELNRANVDFSAAKQRWQTASDRLRVNPLDFGAIGETFAAQLAGARATQAWTEAASRCGDELTRIAGRIRAELTIIAEILDALDGDRPNQTSDRDLVTDDQLDPGVLRQGDIGDCFLMAEINALLQTQDGQQWLESHVRWDAAAGGHWVTLYENGAPVEVFVQGTIEQGATSSNGPGLAGLYEAAALQRFGWGNVNFGGWPADAYGWITGTQGQEHSPIDDSVRDDMRATLNSGGQVVVASHDGAFGSAESYSVVAYRDAADGSRTPCIVQLAAPHAYTVERVEPNGDVWMRNPWGADNPYDDGGVFLVTKSDFDIVFWQATTSTLP